MKRIDDLLISCHIFHYFDFFPFHVIYSINEIMLRKEEKIKTVDILEQTQDAIDNFSIKIFTKNF